MNNENDRNENERRRQRMLDEVGHPHPWRRIIVAVLVGGAVLLAVFLGSCQP